MQLHLLLGISEGSVDILIALSGALAGSLPGIVVAHSNYVSLSITDVVLLLLLILIGI